MDLDFVFKRFVEGGRGNQSIQSILSPVTLEECGRIERKETFRDSRSVSNSFPPGSLPFDKEYITYNAHTFFPHI